MGFCGWDSSCSFEELWDGCFEIGIEHTCIIRCEESMMILLYGVEIGTNITQLYELLLESCMQSGEFDV